MKRWNAGEGGDPEITSDWKKIHGIICHLHLQTVTTGFKDPLKL